MTVLTDEATGPASTGIVEPNAGTGALLPRPAPARLRPKRALPKGDLGRNLPAVSAFTVVALFATWVTVTTTGLVKPLFLPSPAALGNAFAQAWTGEVRRQHANDAGAGKPRPRRGSIHPRLAGRHPGRARDGYESRRPRGARPHRRVLPAPASARLSAASGDLVRYRRDREGAADLSRLLRTRGACGRAGVLSASADQVNAARSMGASQWQVLLHVVLPAATPDILVGLRIGMGVGWTTLVAAEMVAASAGLGQMVLNASNFLRTDVVIVGILVIGGLAILFEFGMRWLERVLVPWKGKGLRPDLVVPAFGQATRPGS
ncbi:ABC transporter permease [Methylobacterium oryzae CBMB20]